jgi:WD40 repeat protein
VVVAVGMDGWVRMWRVATGESVAEVLVGARPLTSVAFSPDGSRFATGGYDGAVRVWSTNGASQLLVLQGQLSRVYDVGFGRSRDRVVSAGDDGSARVWDAGGLQTFTGRGVTEDVEFSHDGRLIATGSDNGDVRLWNPRTGALVRSVSGRDGRTFARFSPVADELVIARWATSSLFIWPLSTPRPQRLLRLHPGDGEIIARFSPDGTRLIYDDAGKAGTLAVRSVRTGSTIRLGGAPALVYDARISPDEKQAAAVTESGRVLLWRLDRPQRIAGQLVGHRGHINTFDWARDGRIVTAGADRTVRVWDSRTRRGKVLSGHTDEVTTAAFMRGDPNHVLSTSADGTVRLWDARTGDALAVLQQEQTGIYDIAQSPDGTIATLDGNEVVHIFHCPVCGSLAAVRARALADHPPELTDEQRQQFLTESG